MKHTALIFSVAGNYEGVGEARYLDLAHELLARVPDLYEGVDGARDEDALAVKRIDSCSVSSSAYL